MKDCREALAAALAQGLKEDQAILDFAADALRRKGVSTANKKASRTAMQGLVATHVTEHAGGSVATVVEVNSETDFVARNDKFQDLVRLVSRAVAAGPDGSVVGDALRGLVDPETKMSVGTATTDLVASIRENIQVRRAHKLSTSSPHSVLTSYMHSAVNPGASGLAMGKIGVVVQLDAAGGSPDMAGVRALSKQLTMHIAAAAPKYLHEAAVPDEDIAREQSILRDAAITEGVEEKKLDMVLKGRTKKFLEATCLLSQTFIIEEPDVKKPPTIAALLKSKAKALSCGSVTLPHFLRFEVGEGMQAADKPSFAEEVAKMSGSKQ